MPDFLTAETRSALMSRIRGKDTKPELLVRRVVHSMGYRYRLHQRTLPGSPDLVFASRQKVIFVHGCFWHSHAHCRLAHAPKSRLDYWRPKLERNRRRDEEQRRRLGEMGWRTLVVWECQTRDVETLAHGVTAFLGPRAAPSKPEPDTGNRDCARNDYG